MLEDLTQLGLPLTFPWRWRTLATLSATSCCDSINKEQHTTRRNNRSRPQSTKSSSHLTETTCTSTKKGKTKGRTRVDGQLYLSSLEASAARDSSQKDSNKKQIHVGKEHLQQPGSSHDANSDETHDGRPRPVKLTITSQHK